MAGSSRHHPDDMYDDNDGESSDNDTDYDDDGDNRLEKNKEQGRDIPKQTGMMGMLMKLITMMMTMIMMMMIVKGELLKEKVGMERENSRKFQRNESGCTEATLKRMSSRRRNPRKGKTTKSIM